MAPPTVGSNPGDHSLPACQRQARPRPRAAIRTLAAAALVAFAMGAPAGWAQQAAQVADGGSMASDERALYRKALTAAQEGRWKTAGDLAHSGDHALATKIVDWLIYRERGTAASFAEIAAFVDAQPRLALARDASA